MPEPAKLLIQLRCWHTPTGFGILKKPEEIADGGSVQQQSFWRFQSPALELEGHRPGTRVQAVDPAASFQILHPAKNDSPFKRHAGAHQGDSIRR